MITRRSLPANRPKWRAEFRSPIACESGGTWWRQIPPATADTRTLILERRGARLLADGYAGLSTRKVAEEAGVPLSQLHYHFGSKQGLILALLEEENQRRLARQREHVRRGCAAVAAL